MARSVLTLEREGDLQAGRVIQHIGTALQLVAAGTKDMARKLDAARPSVDQVHEAATIWTGLSARVDKAFQDALLAAGRYATTKAELDGVIRLTAASAGAIGETETVTPGDVGEIAPPAGGPADTSKPTI